MLALKEGVDIKKVQPEIVIGIAIVASCFADLKYHCTVTACRDGKHMEGSLHYKGFAVDIRSRDIRNENGAALMATCKEALGAQFDLVIESDHWHLEFDPKK